MLEETVAPVTAVEPARGTSIVGFGLRVIPHLPYCVVHGPTPPELDIEHHSRAGPRFARLLPDGPGRYQSRIDHRTPTLGDVLKVEPGPVEGGWQLETREFRVAFPPGFGLYSAPPSSTSPFDLVGPGSSQLYVQSPAQVPPLQEMCAPGQRAREVGEDWIELDYEHAGRKWWQRHQVRGRLVFSTQAPAESRDAALAALRKLLESLVLL
jgi:hypothetical protein